ncbi:MAG: hypothetical protein A2086_07345 [Spirochaetes bacterium GWD1_27_9]|nr:MAG: hypothetical protein A2Z98_07520 [Spirochaetes bacterium GWB1_27_13]OHD20548.1 MAG: hypothetical protein A2Y34_17780 [Spirochaetes bacterium GWC1_27_15]OHD29108.1 MAG: hypothetical protein A2086_07345 [Spirochaetes bacterium GWD1_27_9]
MNFKTLTFRFTLSISIFILFFVIQINSIFAEESMSVFEYGTIKEVNNAIKQGVKMGTNNRYTPLIAAASCNSDPEVIKLLVKAGENINGRGPYGKTVLMWAASNNKNPEIVNTLIQLGAEVEAKTIDGSTALLECATTQTNYKVMESLINAGAKSDVLKSDNKSVLHLVLLINPIPEMLIVLLRSNAKKHINLEDSEGTTPLIAACNKDIKPKILEMLVSYGAKVNWQNSSGETALMRASSNQDCFDLVKKLLELGANPTLKNKEGQNSLHHAGYWSQNPEIIDLLVKAGTPLEDKDNYGQTPLLRCSQFGGSADVLKAFIDAGANTNVKDTDGKTAFYYAERNDNFKTSSVLKLLKTDNFETSEKNITIGDKKAFSTLEEAINKASSGDVIKIKQGLYVVDSEIIISNKKNIKIVGEGFVDIICSVYVSILVLNNCDNITIENLHIVHKMGSNYNYNSCEVANANVIDIYESENITIKNCELNGCGNIGIYCNESDKIIIQDNYIHSNVTYGISLNKDQKSITKIVIENNRIINNAEPIYYNYETIYKDTSSKKEIIMKNNTIFPF